MSTAELARKIGVPANRVTGILHGPVRHHWRHRLRSARFFGASAEILA
jgi:hypothetical protein